MGNLFRYTNFCNEEIPFMSKQLALAEKNQAYKGLRVYHNTPLAGNTLLKIDALVQMGAEVIVSAPAILEPLTNVIRVLEEAEICVDLEKKQVHDIDVYLDCCAEMIGFPEPKLGYVELTQSGDTMYRQANLNKPIISVDNSVLKCLETLGTGAGFVGAVQALTSINLENKKIVLFGYGKVGRGIHIQLRPFTKNITVIEKSSQLRQELVDAGFSAISFNETELIKRVCADCDIVVTATGQTGFMSQYFTKDDFPTKCILANMGATDEYGKEFDKQDVLCGKAPINFSQPSPTPIHFLDPIFYAHNKAIDYLLDGSIDAGYHPFPRNKSVEIVKQWQAYHQIDLQSVIPNLYDLMANVS